MNLKSVILSLLCGLICLSASAQADLDWLLKLPAFSPTLKAHLKALKRDRKAGFPVVSMLHFWTEHDTLIIDLSAITRLSNLEKDLPTSFTTIKEQPILIYDDAHPHAQDDASWFETVKKFVGANLCDDLTYLKLLAQPGPKELVVPCAWLYHPSFDQSRFWQGRLIRHTFRLTG